MSVRAYRVVEIISDDASFNLWSDHELMNFLGGETLFFDSLGSDGTGMVDVPVKVLRKALRKAKDLNLSVETVERLRKDIESTRTNKEESVTYYCF